MKNFLYISLICLATSIADCKEDGYPLDARHELPARHDEILVKYARIRKQQMEHIAEDRGIAIAPEFKKFFEAASAGNCKEADKLYEGFRKRSHQWASNEPLDPKIANELWQPVHEVGWVYGEFAAWDPESVDLFAQEILKSIPNGSIFFGGTDPGRFLISAFQVSQGRSNVFVITQNALADMSYANYIQDLYGNVIWLPAETNMVQAYQMYIEDVRSGKRPQNNALKITDGGLSHFVSLSFMSIRPSVYPDRFFFRAQ